MALYNPAMQDVRTFLIAHMYRIPDYQREYSWESDNEVADFWEDLLMLANDRATNKNAVHFFGQTVVHEDKENNTYNLIDGQQRITTSIILLAVFRDLFADLRNTVQDAEDEYNEIKSTYIGRYKQTTGDDRLRFHLGGNDMVFFRNNIQVGDPQQKSETPSQQRILNAYKSLYSKVIEDLSDYPSDNDKYARLTSLLDSFVHGFQLLTLMTDDINEAFVIFETLNARGKDLETADLLKNFFFMKSNGSVANINQIKEHWSDMTNTLEKKGDTTKLIRYYWNSTRKYIHDKQLYKEISHTVTTYVECLQMVKDLELVAELYNSLSNPFENDCFSDKKINKHLRNLLTIKTTTFYPVIMAMVLKKCSNEEVCTVLSAIEVMSFRNFTIAGNNPNKIEKFLASEALKLYKGEITPDDAAMDIRGIAESDETIRVLISQFKPSVNVAKFILREVENYIVESSEKKIDESNTLINLEHIMPQNNSVWQYPAEEHDEVYQLLGNLTLLAEKLNKAASNDLFENKKSKYEKSAIMLTKSLCQYAYWNKDTIRERSEMLADKILEIWAL